MPTPQYTLASLLDKIEPLTESGCWIWMGTMSPEGYGIVHDAHGSSRGVHRLLYTLLIGPIPDGLVCDHRCRVRCCANPDHLRLVTPRINATENSHSVAATNAAKTHCLRGHPLSGANVKPVTARGVVLGRRCRTCERHLLTHPKPLTERNSMPPKSTTYPTPRQASYSIDGKFAYPVLVLGERASFGRVDYRICLETDKSLCQYVSASKLTFTEEAQP